MLLLKIEIQKYYTYFFPLNGIDHFCVRKFKTEKNRTCSLKTTKFTSHCDFGNGFLVAVVLFDFQKSMRV